MVRLRSGGHAMPVLKLDGNGADCRWPGGVELQTVWVSFACLERAEAPPMAVEVRMQMNVPAKWKQSLRSMMMALRLL